MIKLKLKVLHLRVQETFLDLQIQSVIPLELLEIVGGANQGSIRILKLTWIALFAKSAHDRGRTCTVYFTSHLYVQHITLI